MTKVCEKARAVLLDESKPSPCAGAQVWGVMDAYAPRRLRASCPVVVLLLAPRDDWLGGGGTGPWTLFQCLQSSDIRFDRLLVSSERQTYVPVK